MDDDYVYVPSLKLRVHRDDLGKVSNPEPGAFIRVHSIPDRNEDDEDLRDAATAIAFVAILYVACLVVMWAW